jgi:hypothetical protein
VCTCDATKCLLGLAFPDTMGTSRRIFDAYTQRGMPDGEGVFGLILAFTLHGIKAKERRAALPTIPKQSEHESPDAVASVAILAQVSRAPFILNVRIR